jgi:hypothetical protein
MSTAPLNGYAFAIKELTAATADQEVIAAKAGFCIVVDSMIITNGVAAGTVFFESGSTAISAVHHFGINGGLFLGDGNGPLFRTASGVALTATTVGAGALTNLTIRFHYE